MRLGFHSVWADDSAWRGEASLGEGKAASEPTGVQPAHTKDQEAKPEAKPAVETGNPDDYQAGGGM